MSGTFTGEKIKIRGGNYKAIDTGDGYFTVKDVPLMSTVKKGVKGAPYDVDEKILGQFVDEAQRIYHGNAPFCGTAFIGHNPDVPVSHPDFVGYVLPNRLGTYEFNDGERPCIFGDVKMSSGMFDRARRGELPYTSPEVPWAKKRITGLAFLDTQPPHFEFALFTIGDVVKDETAKFEAIKEDDMAAEFKAEKKAKMEDDDKGESKEHEKKEEDRLKKIEDRLGKMEADFAAAVGKKGKFEDVTKPTALPAEPEPDKKGAKMELDPEFAAKFAAQTNTIAEIQAKLSAQDNERRAIALVAKADAALVRRILTPALKEQIASFAADAVLKKDGEAWFDKFVESLKPSLREKPTAPAVFTGTPVDVSDPDVAKFSKDGTDAMDEAAKFAAEFEQISASPMGRFISYNKEQYIANQMGLAKANRNGAFTLEQRR